MSDSFFKAFVILTLLGTMFIAGTTKELATGGDTGLYVRLNSQATSSVGHQANTTIFTEDLNCAGRTVSAAELPVYLSFTSDMTPSSTLKRGVLVGTSSTLYLAADDYGCGAVTAASTATTTITVAEFNF